MRVANGPYDTTRIDSVCRSALARGPLVVHKSHQHLAWRFGRRLVSAATVARLVAAGAAVRDGNTVRAA